MASHVAVNQRWYGVQTLEKKRKARARMARLGTGSYRNVRFTATPAAPTQPHYRRAADTYAEAPDGTVQIWNGIDKPLTFDPAIATTASTGVKAPANAVSLGGTGIGGIVGTFTAYLRYVDRNGNTSSFSPISNTFAPQQLAATITNVTYAAPMVVTTSAPHGLGTNQIVKITGVIGNTAANDTWQIIVQSSTTFALYAGGGVPSLGNGVYVSGGTVYTGVAKIVYDNVAVPTESKVVRRQLLRNKDGDTSVYFIDIDTTDLTSTTFYSGTDDASLVLDVSLFDANGETLVTHSVPPTHKKFVAHCLGRMFAAGNEPYSEGAVVVTNGSATVTGIGTEWGQLTFAGRFLEVVGGDQRYTIQSVESATSLTLAKVYAGATDPYAYYSISNGPAERRTIYWTQPSQPEAWPATFLLPMAEDPGAGEITGLMPLRSWLYIWCENRCYRFSFVEDPLTDGEVVTAASRGCVNNRCWVKIDENVVYGMDTVGFYLFIGNDLNDISTPAVVDMFRNRPSGPYRINWAARRNFHAVYDPGEATVRWFICLGENYAPYHAVCYQIRLRRWWVEEYPFPIGASCLGRLNGKPQVYLGTDAKRIMALHQSTLDAVDPNLGTVRGVVTSAGYDWIADSTASFQSGLAGQEVQIVGGKGKGQHRRIVSVSGTQINMNAPWTDRPDTTSSYQIGGVRWKWRGGWLQFTEGKDEKQRAVSLQFTPTTAASTMFMRIFQDMSSSAKKDWTQVESTDQGNGIASLINDPATDLAIDTTKSNGYVRQRWSGMREFNSDGPRFVAIELGGVTNDDPLSILQLTMDEMSQ